MRRESNLFNTENNLSITESNLFSTESNLFSTESNLFSTESNLFSTESNPSITERIPSALKAILPSQKTPFTTVVSGDFRPALFFLRQANARSGASKRGDCLSEASSSPFSGTKEESRRKNTALILSFGIFSFVSRRKKSTLRC